MAPVAGECLDEGQTFPLSIHKSPGECVCCEGRQTLPRCLCCIKQKIKGVFIGFLASEPNVSS